MSLFFTLLRKNPILNRAYQSADPDRFGEESYFDNLLLSVVMEDAGPQTVSEVAPEAECFVATNQLVTLLLDRSDFLKYSSDKELDAWISAWKMPKGYFRIQKNIYFFNGRRFLPTGEKCTPQAIELVSFDDPRISVPSLEIFLTHRLSDGAPASPREDEEFEAYYSSRKPSAYVLNIKEANKLFGLPSYEYPSTPPSSTDSSVSSGFVRDVRDSFMPSPVSDDSSFSTVRSKSKPSSSKAGKSGEDLSWRRYSGATPQVSSVVRDTQYRPGKYQGSGPTRRPGRTSSYSGAPPGKEKVPASSSSARPKPVPSRDKRSYGQASKNWRDVNHPPGSRDHSPVYQPDFDPNDPVYFERGT